MRSLALLTALGLTLASCGSSDNQQGNTTRISVQKSENQKALHKLGDLNRSIALKRAIHASGKQCVRVDRSAYVTEHGNLSMWTASCNDGRSWALFIGPDDSVQVRDCAQTEQLGLPACRIDGAQSGAKPAA